MITVAYAAGKEIGGRGVSSYATVDHKGEFDIEQTIKRVQHKENKLAGMYLQFVHCPG